jgi:predicted  nucleic acid-binding Zn-ribbon protein
MNRDRRDREAKLEETKAHIARLKNRSGDIKTNTAYFAHLKEIDAAEKLRSAVEDEILGLMEKVEAAEGDLSAFDAKVSEESASFEGRRQELERNTPRGRGRREDEGAENLAPRP